MKFLLFSACLLPFAAPMQPTTLPGPLASTAHAAGASPAHQPASSTLQAELARTVAGFAGTVGVAVRGVETGDSAQVNGGAHLPMQSVYKFPLALAVLHQVARGHLQLDQKLLLRPADLLPNTWSPLREHYPGGNVRVPLREVLRYTVSESDNNGCDILFRLLGGPAAVQAYVRSLGVTTINIAATEEEMHRREDVQYTNWATPAAMCRLFADFGRGRYLTPASQAVLRQMLATGPTGPQRLRAGVPPGTEVAHKTGTSGTNAAGLTAATNDAGLLTLPNGQHVAVVVFVANATASEAECESLIAAVSRVVWRHFTAKS
ncbi:MAG: class A beta-lactamase, subclass A2 [Janthinobacterium lividum]